MKILTGMEARRWFLSLDESQRVEMLNAYVKLMRENILEGENYIRIDDDRAFISADKVWPHNESCHPYAGIATVVEWLYGTAEPEELPLIVSELLALKDYLIDWQNPEASACNNWKLYDDLLRLVDDNATEEWQYMGQYTPVRERLRRGY